MDVLTRPDLAPARYLFEGACRASRLHQSEAQRALANYGSHGPLISGCVRSHFPKAVKDRLRGLAQAASARSDAAYAARPPRVRFATMRRLARAVATRDGSGRYGPQPANAPLDLSLA